MRPSRREGPPSPGYWRRDERILWDIERAKEIGGDGEESIFRYNTRFYHVISVQWRVRGGGQAQFSMIEKVRSVAKGVRTLANARVR